MCQQLSQAWISFLYPVTDFYSRGVKFSMVARASSAAESLVIYVLLSESSRFKSEVSGLGSMPYIFVCVCVWMCI